MYIWSRNELADEGIINVPQCIILKKQGIPKEMGGFIALIYKHTAGQRWFNVGQASQTASQH